MSKHSDQADDLVVVTNDDGVQAEGLEALYQAAHALGRPIVVAPSQCYSECSHSITTKRCLEVTEVRTGWYSVTGTPSDCVRLALGHLAKNAKWVLSGINHGANLGGDVWVSGTVAAAREAAMRGCAAIAVSQYRRPDVTLCWKTSAERAGRALQIIRERSATTGWFWNVNLPAIEPHVDAPLIPCRLDPLPLPVAYQSTDAGYRYVSRYHDRPRTPGHDVDRCFSGAITLTHVAAAVSDTD